MDKRGGNGVSKGPLKRRMENHHVIPIFRECERLVRGFNQLLQEAFQTENPLFIVMRLLIEDIPLALAQLNEISIAMLPDNFCSPSPKLAAVTRCYCEFFILLNKTNGMHRFFGLCVHLHIPNCVLIIFSPITKLTHCFYSKELGDESHPIAVPESCENMHEYSSSTTLQHLLTYVLVPCCAYSQLIIQLYSVYRRGTEVHSPPQYQASIVKAYTITKLRKVLNGPPTKQYAHLVVKQHFLNRFLFSGMLLSCGQVRIASHM